MESLLKKLTTKHYPGVFCGIIILVLTGIPGSCFPRVKPIVGMDKVAHALMYAVFAFLCLWGYRHSYRTAETSWRKKMLVLAAFISIVYGGFTEIMQEYLVPGRIGDTMDFLADALGTLLGVGVFAFFFKRKK